MNQMQLTVRSFLAGVRTEGTKAKPLFCMKDVAPKLGLTRGGGMAVAWRLPDDEKDYRWITLQGGPQPHLFITTTGFLRLAIGGRTAESKAFRDQISWRELPTILQPPEVRLVRKHPPKRLDALPPSRREHVAFWLTLVTEIAHSLRRNETVNKLFVRHKERGGVSRASCRRYFKLWVDAGGDWRAFDGWWMASKVPRR